MNKRPSTKNIPTALNHECCSTGVAGLDEILAGGFPRSSFFLIQGDPGSGKTTLALQFPAGRRALWRNGLLCNAFGNTR